MQPLPFSTLKATFGTPSPGMMVVYGAVRTHTGNLPFVGTSTESVEMQPKQESESGEWIGVECVHGDRPSPHLTGTHIESVRHVRGDGKSLERVFADCPHYLGELEGLRVKVQAAEKAIEKMSSGKDDTILHFEGGESYTLRTDLDVSDIRYESIVTRESLQAAIERVPSGDDSILLIEIEGYEDAVDNWPYLTNEATRYLAESGFNIVALNTPSIDREKDGGRTSNHKIFFENEDRLIIESAALRKPPVGRVTVAFDPEQLGAFPDCASLKQLVISRR